MKQLFAAFTPATRIPLALALLFAFTAFAGAAGPFNVNITNDTHAVSPGTSANDSGDHISLRSAIEAANAQAGTTIINVPPGTYNLAFGELDLATNAGKNITIQASGGTAANTFVNQTNGNDRVFNIDPNSLGNTTVTLSGLAVQGGHDKTDLTGGAAILAGSLAATPKDVLNLTGCVIANNHCSPPNTNYTAQIGGGVQMAGGDLNITSCTFSNNTSGASQGGAIAFFTQGVASSLNISNTIFANNSMTNTSGSGPDGGGAIFIGSTAASVHVIRNSTFNSNRAISVFGNTYGGAIELNTGTLNITNSTFTGNVATSPNSSGGQGGALYVDSGTNNVSFCRLVSNTAPNGGGAIYNHNSNGANTMAVNNWWGCNGGPGASGCDVAATDIGGLTISPFIVLTNIASPAVILPNQTTTLTASFLRNSVGAILTPSQIGVLLGLPVTWNNAVLGTISSPQTTIQTNGTATATFTAGSTPGTGQANASVDSGVATAVISIACPSITGSVNGGGIICSGDTAFVTVSVSGGIPPYSITLNNGGGTQSGSGPFNFTVSPTSTTIYQISSGQDSEACPVTDAGTATVTVNLAPPAIIAPTPASVFANSGGNMAATPSGFASYAWTINNGFIIGPTNLPAVSYVAGVSGNVTVGLTASSACATTNVFASVPIVTGLSVHTNLTFTNAIPATATGIAFDGTNYWDCSGSDTSGARLGRYNSAGTLIAKYSPGLDFRSIFTRADGTVLARAYNDAVIYRQTSPGVLVNSGVSLTGGTLDAQSSVVLNGDGTEYDAMNAGVVSRWSTNGTYLGSVTLQDFGSVSGENAFPQNRGLAAFRNLWLTYSGNGLLSAWDYFGNRVFQTVLPGAGTSFDSDFSFSCCNGKVFLVDVSGGFWRAFDISGGVAKVAVLAAETTTSWAADVTNKIFGVGSIQQVDLIFVTASNPTPAQLQTYQSVLVFSDNNFYDPTGLGDELADYIDQGGGVVLNTFSIDSTSDGYGIQGRLTNGYLPFTTGTAAYPANLTLVPDMPTDFLLNGVNSFNGGNISFQDSSLSLTPGATLIAHWSNGQPLVGKKTDGAGRSVGLNFFPPSSDAFSSSWVASTDGAKLMANALVWAGSGRYPTIISAPADQVVAAGGTAMFSVVAAGASPLRYQWRFNGINLPLATNIVLSFTVQTGNLGEYSVVVSNSYGQTCSGNVSLSPPLRFLPPTLSAGHTIPLFLANSDGSLVASNRAVRVQIYATTNLAQPFIQWLPLTNAVIPSGGLLQLNGLTTTNPATRYFRALEIP